MKEINVCGLSCPEPVLKAQKAMEAIESGETLVVIADTATSRDNVARAARRLGFLVTVEETDKEYRISVTRNAAR